LWLRSDSGLETVSGVAPNDGDGIQAWRDESGSGNDLTAPSASERPIFRSAAGGSVDFENGSYYLTRDAIITGTTARTFFTVIQPSSVSSSNVTGGSANNAAFALAPNSSTESVRGYGLFVEKPDGGTGLGLRVSGNKLMDYTADGFVDSDLTDSPALVAGGGPASATLEETDFFLNGTELITVETQSNQTEILDTNAGGVALGGYDTDGDFDNGLRDEYDFNGDIYEVIVFSADLNDTRRVLIENYLSAKYDITLSGTDVYAGDTNGDYDFGVFGIGREAASDFHVAAETDGLRFDNPSGLEDGDYLMAGHKTSDNQVTSQDISSPVQQRMQRVWFADVTDSGAGLTADITFDLSKAGLSTLAGDASNYVLLEQSSAGTGPFTQKIAGADAASDDQITFNGVSLTDGSGITLGTTDPAASPLSGIALTITGTEDNEGDATTGEFGGDAGWRMIGPPVTSATAGDLVSGSDQNGSIVEFSLGQGQMLYRWDDASGSGSWAPITSGSESLENGRGHILFLFDDKGTPDADPLDPSITLDLANSSQGDVPSGQVTVKSLNRDADFHVLANPYNQPYDLTKLEQKQGQDKGIGTGGTDFQATVQIWDGGTTNQTIAQAGSYIDVTVNETVEGGTADMAPLGDVISAWQGFVVERRNQGGGTAQQLRFQPDGRTSGTRSIVGSKSQKASPGARFAKIGLAMTVTDESGRQVARDAAASVAFHPEANADWDAFDASKLSPLTGRYAVLGPIGRTKADTSGMKAVESRSRTLTEPLEIPLRLQTKGQVAGTARIGVDNWKGVPKGWTVTLIDTKRTDDSGDDTEHEISPDGSVYSFAIGSRPKGGGNANSVKTRSAFGDGAPRIRRLNGTEPTRRAEAKRNKGEPGSTRFRLRIEPGSVLPVEFSGIDAVTDGRRVTLNWSTTAETNNAGFAVEHRRFSTNARGDTVRAGSWKQLGFVEGTGTTDATQTYRYETSELDYGQHSFRLRQVDTDGSMSLSDPVDAQILLDRAYAVTSPSPHPVRRQTSIDLTVRQAQSITVEVYDLLGRRVGVPFEEKVDAQQTRNIRLDAAGFSSGVYFLRIRGDSFATTERMTVVK
jgi:hypothetical protein